MPLRRVLVVACAAFVAMALVGCSRTAPPADGAPQAAASATPAAATSSPQALKHPCTLLTASDAEAVPGVGAKLKRNSDSSCILETPNPLGPVIEVKIEKLPSTWDGGEMMMKFDREAKKVEGIGDGAYTFGGGTIIFKKGAAEVSVITSAYQGRKSKFDAAKYLAERLVAAM